LQAFHFVFKELDLGILIILGALLHAILGLLHLITLVLFKDLRIVGFGTFLL
jgi:hypothetical protein